MCLLQWSNIFPTISVSTANLLLPPEPVVTHWARSYKQQCTRQKACEKKDEADKCCRESTSRKCDQWYPFQEALQHWAVWISTKRNCEVGNSKAAHTGAVLHLGFYMRKVGQCCYKEKLFKSLKKNPDVEFARTCFWACCCLLWT